MADCFLRVSRAEDEGTARASSGRLMGCRAALGVREHEGAREIGPSRRAYNPGGTGGGTTVSSAAATRYIRSSAIVGAITCRPTGSPSDSPHGTEIAGPP